MNCDDVRRDLADRLDGLLPTGRVSQVDAHLAQCEACAVACEQLTMLRERVYAPVAVAAPAEQLRARIVARAASTHTPRSARRILIPCVVSFAAGVLVTLAVIGRRIPDPAPTAAPAPVEIQEARPVAPPPLRRVY